MLVDYGNMYQVKLENIRTEIYAENIPIQCIRLVLAGVEPVGGVWTQECLDMIQEKINYARQEGNNKLSVTVVSKCRALHPSAGQDIREEYQGCDGGSIHDTDHDLSTRCHRGIYSSNGTGFFPR